MQRTMLLSLHVFGWIELVFFTLFSVFGLIAGLSGELDEGGYRSRWYHSVGLAAMLLAYGLPGLAIVWFTRRRLTKMARDAAAVRGFEPLVRGMD